MLKKTIILAIILIFSSLVPIFSQKKAKDILHYTDYVGLETTVGTYYKNPLIGISLNREIKDNRYPVFFNINSTYYIHTFEKPNYLFLQCGFGYNGFKKVDLGVLLFNYQRSYSKTLKPFEINYDGPFALYLRLKNPYYPNTKVYLEGSYSLISNITAFRFSIKQNLYTITKK